MIENKEAEEYSAKLKKVFDFYVEEFKRVTSDPKQVVKEGIREALNDYIKSGGKVNVIHQPAAGIPVAFAVTATTLAFIIGLLFR